tara:strand:+ start:394 stop:933 length:540 start_codon:yes stop_codon:yes gene_type:complete
LETVLKKIALLEASLAARYNKNMRYILPLLILIFLAVPSITIVEAIGTQDPCKLAPAGNPPRTKDCSGLTKDCVSEDSVCLNLDYPVFPGGLNLKTDQSLTTLAAWFYTFLVSISGLAAFVMIVWGGIQWMTSSGDTGKISDAKDRIQKALLGLLIVLSSFLILQVINPDLTNLSIPGT